MGGVGDKNRDRHLGTIRVANPYARGGGQLNLRRKTDRIIMFYEIKIKCNREKVERILVIRVGLEVVLMQCMSQQQEYE